MRYVAKCIPWCVLKRRRFPFTSPEGVFCSPILTAMLSTAEIRNCLYILVLATWRITPPQTGPSSSLLINATMNPFIDAVRQAHSQRHRRNPHENEK